MLYKYGNVVVQSESEIRGDGALQQSRTRTDGMAEVEALVIFCHIINIFCYGRVGIGHTFPSRHSRGSADVPSLPNPQRHSGVAGEPV